MMAVEVDERSRRQVLEFITHAEPYEIAEGRLAERTEAGVLQHSADAPATYPPERQRLLQFLKG